MISSQAQFIFQDSSKHVTVPKFIQRSAPSGGEGTIVDETGNIVVPRCKDLTPQCISLLVGCCLKVLLTAILQVIGEASHLSGYSFSSHNNIIHPSCVLGSKTTVSLLSYLFHN